MKNLFFVLLSLGFLPFSVLFAQNNTDSLKLLTTEAQNLEIMISRRVVTQGRLFLRNYRPAASFTDQSTRTIVEIVFADNERTMPINFIVWSDGKYFWDRDCSGQVNGYRIDENQNAKMIPSKESFRDCLLFMENPNQAELDSSTMDNKFFYVDLINSKAYSTQARSIFKISNNDIGNYKYRLQEIYLEVLRNL